MNLSDLPNLPKFSHQKVEIICFSCSVKYKTRFCYATKNFQKFNNFFCKRCSNFEKFKKNPLLKDRLKERHGKNHPSFGKKRPDVSQRMSQFNPMKQQEARKKVSEWRKNMPKAIREKYSNAQKKCWEDGLFDGVPVGQCKWYEYTKKDGIKIKCQGTWELSVAKWLDDNDIEFDCHKGRIEYFDDEKKKRNYYPDFFLKKEKKYIDVKNDYHISISQKKFELIRLNNPHLNIEIWNKDFLLDKNILLK